MESKNTVTITRYDISIIICLVFVILVALLGSNASYAGITAPRLVSPTDAISLIGVLVTLATFLVSLKVTSVGYIIMRTFLVRETTRQVLLSVKIGSTFDEIQNSLHFTPAQLSAELMELVKLGLVKKKSESIANKGLVEKYYRNI